MAIVVDMGGGNPLEGALQGMAGYAQGYQQAVDQQEEREELRRKRNREEESHQQEMLESAKALEILEAEEERAGVRWGFEESQLERDEKEDKYDFRQKKREDKRERRSERLDREGKRLDNKAERQRIRQQKRESGLKRKERKEAARAAKQAKREARRIAERAEATNQRAAANFVSFYENHNLVEYFTDEDHKLIRDALNSGKDGKPDQESIEEARRIFDSATGRAMDALDGRATGSMRAGELGTIVIDSASGTYDFSALVDEGVISAQEAELYSRSMAAASSGMDFPGRVTPSAIASQIRASRTTLARREIAEEYRLGVRTELEEGHNAFMAELRANTDLFGPNGEYETFDEWLDQGDRAEHFEDMLDALAELRNPHSTDSPSEIESDYRNALKRLNRGGLDNESVKDLERLRRERDDAVDELNQMKREQVERQKAQSGPTQEAPYGYRIKPDGSAGEPKGEGWRGELRMTGGPEEGAVATEMSITVGAKDLGGPDNGGDVAIPLLVPTLTDPEVEALLAGQDPTDEVVRKAVAHAKTQIENNKSPFKGGTEVPDWGSGAAPPPVAPTKRSRALTSITERMGVAEWPGAELFTDDELELMSAVGLAPGTDEGKKDSAKKAKALNRKIEDKDLDPDDPAFFREAARQLEMSGIDTTGLSADDVKKTWFDEVLVPTM
jgi:hypothetical protein